MRGRVLGEPCHPLPRGLYLIRLLQYPFQRESQVPSEARHRAWAGDLESINIFYCLLALSGDSSDGQEPGCHFKITSVSIDMRTLVKIKSILSLTSSNNHEAPAHLELPEDVLGHVVLGEGVHHEVLVPSGPLTRPVLGTFLLKHIK